MSRVVLRRQLRASERHINVEGLVAALERGKTDLHAAIVVEQRRVARALARGRRSRMQITPEMTRVLRRLYLTGVAAARAEAASMGVPLKRTLEAEPAPPPPGTRRAYRRLTALLGGLSDKLQTEHAARLEVVAAARPEMVRALNSVPGALDAAGRVVSTTLFSGLGDVFAANADAFGGWEHTAILDGGTCDECETADGTVYPTWEAAQDDLPDGGPYVKCLGEDRCRCRLVPLAPREAG